MAVRGDSWGCIGVWVTFPGSLPKHVAVVFSPLPFTSDRVV